VSESGHQDDTGLGHSEGPSWDIVDEAGPTTHDSEGLDNTGLPDITSPGYHGDNGPSQPGPVDEQDIEEADFSWIQLPDLQTTQHFVNALKSATLEGSGMEPQDIAELRQPGLPSGLVDPSPLVRSLRHFINNLSASREHYDTIR